ncbi:hypothetical protein C2G38_2195644 [Gigaspora rosea]|uniref:Histidine kinase domain-containing protein n=1 Tax=Gigaspora rosea TaxID=44941 RepID=A0A397UVJ1_9GLOM|nr:hypothetical protein C2G38_2195644 [Gigaspora rosea]
MKQTSMTSNSIIHGIPAYIEPQCLIERGYKHDKTSDIYSFGKSFGKFQTYNVTLSNSPKPSFKYTPNVKKCRTVVGSSAKETISTPQIMFQQSKVQEITQKVLNTRRLKILNDFGRKMPVLEKACCITTEVLSNKDIPYALIYFVEPRTSVGSKSMIARLVSTTFDDDDKKECQFPGYFPGTPKIIDLSKDVDKRWKTCKVLLKDGSQAVLLLANSLCGNQELSAILICGINRLCTLDEKYLVVNQMNTCLLQGKTREEEKKMAKILADLNFQKVSFFQGISHELKLPLTLMLSPLEDVINKSTRCANNVVSSNSNIVEYTQELASDFKNIAKKLGLVYNIGIPSPEEFNKAAGDKIYLDHDMYETILYNLCKFNALKHTWNDTLPFAYILITDTGDGIPEAVLPNIFRRFYRVESQGSRSHEGTGIGLALVKELITRYGGDITVTSVINQERRLNAAENQSRDDKELYINRQLYLEWSNDSISDDIMDQVSTEDQMLINNQNMNINILDQVSTKDQMSIDNQNLNVNIVNTSEKWQILFVEDNNDMRHLDTI